MLKWIDTKSRFCLLLIAAQLLSFSSTFAQSKVDSLKRLVQTQEIHTSLNHYLIAQLYYNKTYNYSKGEDSTLKYLDEAKILAQQYKEDSLLACIYFYETRALNREGRFEDAIKSGLKAKELFAQRGDSNIVTRTQIILAYNYQDLGLYDDAIQHLEEGIRRAEALNDSSSLALLYSTIGSIFNQAKSYERSRFYAKKSIKILKILNQPIELGGLYNNLARSFGFDGMYDSAYYYFEKALNTWKEVDFKTGEATVYGNLGELYTLQKNLDRAIDYNLKSLVLFEEQGDKKKIIDSYLKLGQLYLEVNKVDKAREYMIKADTTAPEVIPFYSTLALTLLKSKIYELDGNYKKALDYRNKYDAKQDSIESQEVKDKVAAADRRIKFISDAKENELEISKLRAEQKSKELQTIKQKVWFAIAVFLLILILTILFFTVKKRRFERKVLEQNLIKKENLNKKLEQEVSIKKKKLSSYALQLIDKNKKLDNIKQSIVEVKNSLKDDELAHRLSKLEKELEKTKNSEQRWEEFKLYFEEVHVDFYSRIQSKHPSLTNKELRLAALLRLNLSTKEIANLLNLPTKTIEMARYRLRKKLELESNENLINYIISV